jgi:DNA repair photolyase
MPRGPNGRRVWFCLCGREHREFGKVERRDRARGLLEIELKLDVIYQPKGEAGEYAPWATNHYDGCGHGCVYCYVPGVRHITRESFDAGADERKLYLERLDKDLAKLRAAGFAEQVMLSFTTDPYNPDDVEIGLTRKVLKRLGRAGLGFCTLTKGGRRAYRDIDLFRRDRDAFASSLTLLDPDASLKWERKAATPDERIKTLRTFHDAGIFTWVSLEPVIDPGTTLEIIRRTAPFVDLYKVGQINYSKLTKLINWREFTLRSIDLLNGLGKAHYIKADLQQYLPPGYPNPLRVPQHH